MHASGKQPGVLLSQLCRVVEALQAENRGRWTATVTSHRRVQVTDKNGLPHMISYSMTLCDRVLSGFQEDTYSRSDRKVARDLSVVNFGNNPSALYLVLRYAKAALLF